MAKPTRNRILDVAEAHFARSGFEGATTRAVASSAGCNVALISYYFGGKLGLYEELLARHFTHVREQFQQFMSDPKHTDAHLVKAWPELAGKGERATRIRRFASLLQQLSIVLSTNEAMSKIVWRELISGGKVASRLLARPDTGALPLLRIELEKLRDDGLIRDFDDRFAVVALGGPVIYSMIAWPVIQASMGFKKLDETYLRGLVLYQVRGLFDGWGGSLKATSRSR